MTTTAPDADATQVLTRGGDTPPDGHTTGNIRMIPNPQPSPETTGAFARISANGTGAADDPPVVAHEVFSTAATAGALRGVGEIQNMDVMLGRQLGQIATAIRGACDADSGLAANFLEQFEERMEQVHALAMLALLHSAQSESAAFVAGERAIRRRVPEGTVSVELSNWASGRAHRLIAT